jgi:hypothetical protein
MFPFERKARLRLVLTRAFPRRVERIRRKEPDQAETSSISRSGSCGLPIFIEPQFNQTKRSRQRGAVLILHGMRAAILVHLSTTKVRYDGFRFSTAAVQFAEAQ